MINAHDITALVLAGGRGTRMGGVDKGLQTFNGTPLALHTLLRLQMQQGGLIGEVMINANRNLAAYEAFGAPVWPDSLPDYAGPLAGFMTGLERCETPFLMTVPCDTPLFPPDLAVRLADALGRENADIAMAAAREEDGQIRTQPVFCLIRCSLMEDLLAFVQEGGRKIDRWTARHRCVTVRFDDAAAFFNANTLEELQRLQG